MEVKSKVLKTANYAVECVSGDYNVEGEVTVNSDGVIEKMGNGVVKNGDVVIARFSQWSEKHLQVTYLTDDKATRDSVNSLLDSFKSVASGVKA